MELSGQIITFDAPKGIGFIQGIDGRHYCFSQCDITNNYQYGIADAQEVWFKPNAANSHIAEATATQVKLINSDIIQRYYMPKAVSISAASEVANYDILKRGHYWLSVEANSIEAARDKAIDAVRQSQVNALVNEQIFPINKRNTTIYQCVYQPAVIGKRHLEGAVLKEDVPCIDTFVKTQRQEELRNLVVEHLGRCTVAIIGSTGSLLTAPHPISYVILLATLIMVWMIKPSTPQWFENK